LIGFSKPGACTRFQRQRSGRCVPLSFAAVGGKIQATRSEGGLDSRWRKPSLKKRIDKLSGVKLLQVINLFPDADVF
jgi:hypothetical protein